MDVVECVGDLAEQVARAPDVHRLRGRVDQRLALEQLHDDVRAGRRILAVVHDRDDVGVVDLARELGLELESRTRSRIERERRRDQLERERLAELRVPRAIHAALPAFTEPTFEHVPTTDRVQQSIITKTALRSLDRERAPGAMSVWRCMTSTMAGDVPIEDVLREYAQPFVHVGYGPRAALDAAAIIWDLVIDGCSSEQITEILDEDCGAHVRKLVEAFVQRKRTLFAADDRYIVGPRVSAGGPRRSPPRDPDRGRSSTAPARPR